MSDARQEKRHFEPPSGPRPAESAPTMKPQDVGPRARKFQDPRAAIEALVSWDELGADELCEIEADPHLAPRLELLREAEAWLARGGAAARACPPAEELYDFGRGPGYQPLGPQARQRLEQHLAGCEECRATLRSLEEAPPSPLELEPAPLRVPSPRRREPAVPATIVELAHVRRRRRVQRWAVAAAASLVGGLSLWLLYDGRGNEFRLPGAPLLRGEGELALHYPRGPVLSAQDKLPSIALPLRFELRAVPEAEGYRVEILRHAGGAFDAGTKVGELRGAREALVLNERLALGSYTWRAYATVHGLERELGARDFEVVDDAALLERLAQAAGADELARTYERVRILHEAGDWTDARELARTLPSSTERDRYLEETPGR